MATIRTTIQVQDNVSRALRSMSSAMQATINSFEHMQRVSGNAVDTSSIEIARRELALAEDAMNSVEQEIRQANEQQQQLNNSFHQGTSAASGLLTKIGAIAATYFGIHTAGNIIELSDQMTNTTARLNLMNDNLQTTAELQEMIFQSAKRTYSPYQLAADMVGKLGMQARAAFGSSQEIIAFAEQINKTFTIAGTSAEGVSSVMLQLTQAMAAGRLQGEELNAILDNAQPIVANIQRYLEQAMNMDASNIKKLASEGILTAEIIKKAMFYAADETNRAFESMPLTFSQIWTNFKNDAFASFRPVLEKLNEIANNEKFLNSVNSITGAVAAFSNVATPALNMIMAIGGYFYDYWPFIAPLIFFIVGAFGALTFALIATKVAQWSLNTAIFASPLFWIPAAIMAIVAVFYYAISVINEFAGTSISATGIIAGSFAVLGAFIFNLVAYWWNWFASIAEFFVNVWQHPIYSVKKLFANMVSNVLDMGISMTKGWDSFATSFVNAIIDAVNGAIKAWNWFIDLLPDSVTGALGLSKGAEFKHRTSITSDLEGFKSKINSWVGEAPSGYWEAPKMNMKSIGGAWDVGSNWGANLFSGNNPNSAVKDAFSGMDGIKGAIDGLGDSGKNTAGNTKKMADSLDMAEEDLKYLRDLAEQEVVNRFTTAEISIDMSGMKNSINNEMDLDGVVSYLEEKVYETMAIAAEGVHE